MIIYLILDWMKIIFKTGLDTRSHPPWNLVAVVKCLQSFDTGARNSVENVEGEIICSD